MITILQKIPGLSKLIPKEPAAVIGIVYSAVVALLWIFAPGTAAEIVSLAGPVLAALHIRTQVFSPETVKAITDKASSQVGEARRAAREAGNQVQRKHEHPPPRRK